MEPSRRPPVSIDREWRARMRDILLALVAATCSVTPAYSQGVRIGPNGIQLDDGRDRDRERDRRERERRQEFREDRRADRCRELRRECEFGDRGEGNCRRYREVCR